MGPSCRNKVHEGARSLDETARKTPEQTMHKLDKSQSSSAKFWFTSVWVLLIFSLIGCAPTVYYVRPTEWRTMAVRDSLIISFRPHLQGRSIFLDPGHGGDDRRNRGPKEDAIEADVNLKVSLALRDYLLRSGAIVSLARTNDTTVALRDRPLLALAAGAEVFISVHHNATADRGTNYTATYYHAYPGHPEYHAADQDLARYVQRDNSYAMRNPGPPFSPSFDGTLSDFGIYPNSGFAVLRDNPLPAVLIEGSFFTHPHEEQKLALREFNEIEAWGIFLGIGKYFRAGVPQLSLASDSVHTTPLPVFSISVSSKEQIEPATVFASLDGAPVPAAYIDSTRSITVTPTSELPGGEHELKAWVRNVNGNSSWQFHSRILIKLPVAKLNLDLHPGELPLLGEAMARATCIALDKNGAPVVDGTPIHFSLSNQELDTTITTLNGVAFVYIPGSTKRELRILEVAADTARSRAVLGFSTSYDTYLTGVVRSALDSTVLAGTEIIQSDLGSRQAPLLDTTWRDGRYIVYRRLPDPLLLQMQRTGYFAYRQQYRHATEPIQADAILEPVAGGRLFGKTYLIDPRYGGAEGGDMSINGLRSADVNLEVARLVHILLRAAGANVILLRDRDTTVAEAERARLSALYGRGMYIRIDAAGRDGQAKAAIYQSLVNNVFAARLLDGLSRTAGLDSAGIVGAQDRFYYDVAMGTISLIIPSVTTGRYEGVRSKRLDEIAWGIFLGILQSEGFEPAMDVTYEVRSGIDEAPLAGIRILLNETLSAVTDERGRVRFYGTEPADAYKRVPGNDNAVIRRVVLP